MQTTKFLLPLRHHVRVSSLLRQTTQKSPFSHSARAMADYKLKSVTSLSLKPGDKQEVEVEGIEGAKVLLLNAGGSIQAVGPKCTHFGAPLVKGVLTTSGRLTCPWHGGTYPLPCWLHSTLLTHTQPASMPKLVTSKTPLRSTPFPSSRSPSATAQFTFRAKKPPSRAVAASPTSSAMPLAVPTRKRWSLLVEDPVLSELLRVCATAATTVP